jgi:acyl carrier protein
LIGLFKALSGAAGLAGISVGVVVVIFREVIRKNIFPRLESQHAYALIRLIIILTFSVGISGMVVWAIDRSGFLTQLAIERSTQSLPPLEGTGLAPSSRSEKPVGTHKQPGTTLNNGSNSNRRPSTAPATGSRNKNDAVVERTYKIIGDELHEPANTLTPTTSLYAGPLNMTELVMQLELAFGIEIPNEDVAGFRTVQDVSEYVLKRLN